jgi:hypothetical protein
MEIILGYHKHKETRTTETPAAETAETFTEPDQTVPAAQEQTAANTAAALPADSPAAEKSAEDLPAELSKEHDQPTLERTEKAGLKKETVTVRPEITIAKKILSEVFPGKKPTMPMTPDLPQQFTGNDSKKHNTADAVNDDLLLLLLLLLLLKTRQ